MKIRGSYTVEATFIVTIVIWIIVHICYGGMYVHDRLILGSVSNEALAFRLAIQESENQWNTEIKSEIQEALFFMDVSSVKIESGLASYKMSVNCTYTIFGKKKKYTYKTERENVNPTIYKWDYDILKGEKN